MTAPAATAAPPAPARDGRAAQQLLIGGKFLSSVAYFAALPFLTLYLSTTGGLAKPAAGAVAGSVAVVSAAGGLAGGYLTDRFGSVRLMKAGLAVYVASYAGLAAVRSLPAIIGLLLAMGVGRAALEPSSKRLMSACATADGAIFRLRYITVAAGAIVGPVAGAVLYRLGIVPFFLFPGAVLLAYLIVISSRGAVIAPFDGAAGTRLPRPSVRSLLGDRLLLSITAAGLFFFAVFSQFESALPLLLHELQGRRGVTLYSLALAGDAVIAIGIQAPLMRLAGRLSQAWMAVTGTACFAASFACLALMSASIWMLAPAVLLFALGEAILLPMPDVLLHKAAPDAHKAAYFGFAELRYLGFLVGPAVGGWLLSLGPYPWGLGFAAAALACLPLFTSADRRLAGAAPVPVLTTQTGVPS